MNPLLEAFEGVSKSQPMAIVIKKGGKRKKVVVGLGSIVVPHGTSNLPEDFEERYRCKVKRVGTDLVITPNVVFEIIEKDGAVCSCDEGHRNMLRSWMQTYGIPLLREILEM